MSDKDLSKPMGYANKFSLEYAQRSGCEFAVYASDDVQGYDVPVYSAEYVQHLLGRIESMAQAHIALQQLCEVYRSAYEEARGIVNTPVKLPNFGFQLNPHGNSLYFALDDVTKAIEAHGLTVQED